MCCGAVNLLCICVKRSCRGREPTGLYSHEGVLYVAVRVHLQELTHITGKCTASSAVAQSAGVNYSAFVPCLIAQR